MSDHRAPAVDPEKECPPSASTTHMLKVDITRSDSVINNYNYNSNSNSNNNNNNYNDSNNYNNSSINNKKPLLPVTFQANSVSPAFRGRSRSWGSITVNEEVTGAAAPIARSPVGTARDDMYMDDVGLRRIFAYEFLANLEDDARKLFQFNDADFEDDGEKMRLQPQSNRRRMPSVGKRESMGRIVVTFFKSMVGSYILYSPKMFSNGGLAAATVTLLVSAWLAFDNMIVLLQLAELTGKNSYGQIGMEAFGRAGLLMVDVSLVMSQLSFCCAYFIFVVKNISSVLPVPSAGSVSEFLLTADILIALQLLVYIPMALIRKLKYLALAMCVANVCLLLGLVMIVFMDTRILMENGPVPVLMYNPDSYIMFMGAVVVCFEGIGLVLPLRDSLDTHLQAQLPGLIGKMMLFLALFFVFFASLGYLAFGENTETFVTMNLPQGSPSGAVSIALYIVAIILTYPLQLFPAVNCIERYIFSGVGPKSIRRKWLKNGVRTSCVIFTAVVARYAGRSYDNFATVVGGVCAVPLALIYPAAFQLRLMGSKLSSARRAWTFSVLILGVFAATLCTWQSISTWK